LTNLEWELAKLKKKTEWMKMTTNQFPPSVKKGNIQIEESQWRIRGHEIAR
jgi:hypothetical protein